MRPNSASMPTSIFAFQNVSSATIPGFAILQLSGSLEHQGQSLLSLTRPAANLSEVYYVNGPQPVPAGAFGHCHHGACYALWDENFATPQFGETWGPQPDDWRLRPGSPGFFILGNELEKRVWVWPNAISCVRGRLLQSLDYRDLANVRLLGTTDSETDEPGLEVLAHDGLLQEGHQLKIGAVVLCTLVVGRWLVTAADRCSEPL